jgi:hypothetical protein
MKDVQNKVKAHRSAAPPGQFQSNQAFCNAAQRVQSQIMARQQRRMLGFPKAIL